MTVLALGTVVSGFAAARPSAADPRSQADGDERVEVTVVEISGYIDRIQARFLRDVVTDSTGRDLVVVRLDSGGAVVGDGEMRRLEQAIARAGAPVAIWVGPSRSARAEDGAERLLAAADATGGVEGVSTESFELDLDAPTLGDFIVAIDGTAGIDVPTEVVDEGDGPPQRRLASNVRVSFAEPSFAQQLLHAVSTPTAAYLLLTIGLLLVVFELFTGGIGVAAAVAVVCIALGGFGLGALPTRPLGLALLLFGVFGYAVDVQVGVPRAWTVIGTGSFVAGSFLLFDGLSMPLLAMAAVLGGVLLFMVAGMPAVVRTRFSTPTIGRESMVGEVGTAKTNVSPEGVVTVRDAPWRARTNRATPIKAGDDVRVAAIDGLLLEVEPLDGAAEDYRERARGGPRNG
ncbi:MAG TPA: NfeD family protein [Acidimicrobiales bacterium]